ncbi:MAG TPA: glycosyltransferase family 2 protein [Steroidobacteraceae bacterium]|nr:glycosyltransferase family 2 protein [Steroidobacteraceae bacterium]
MTAVLLNGEGDSFGLVVIGRNEGERLVRCLNSVRSTPNRVYVDSGSTDGSIEHALSQGVAVVRLEVPPNFTAARARNAGLERLLAESPDLEFVQTVDGDCEIHPGWIAAGLKALRAAPELAAVFGRLRERFPERSVYNALCDESWNASIGVTPIVGGVALFRVAALRQVRFYEPTMIAGEEPELSMRLRKNGWQLRRIDAEMGYHDVDLTRFAQWWKRTRRTGHAYAELAQRHPDARDPNWPKTTRSIVFWGGLMPLALFCAVVLALFVGFHGWLLAGLIFLLWPLHILQIALRKVRAGSGVKLAGAAGALLMIGKIPQLMGLAEYHRNRLMGRASRLIEHKGPGGA